MNKPKIDKTAKIYPGAILSGSVTVGPDSSIWHGAVLRGDCTSITVGKGTNVQDNVTVHGDANTVMTIGDGVTVGHNAVLHGCTIGDNTLVGMGSIVLNDAKIGRNCIIGAGSLVTQGTVIPDNSLAVGSPAKIKRQVTQEEIEGNKKSAREYLNQTKTEQPTLFFGTEK